MDVEAREALDTIQWCARNGRLLIQTHFLERMEERGMVWADVLAILDDPLDVQPGGPEKFDRPKWLLAGIASDGLAIEIVCVLDQNDLGDWAVLITIY